MEYLKQQLHVAEQRALDAEQRAEEAARQEQHTQQLLQKANKHCKKAEDRAAEASRREKISQHLLEEAHKQCTNAETQLAESEDKLLETKHSAQEAEQKLITTEKELAQIGNKLIEAQQTALEAEQCATVAKQTAAEAEQRSQELIATNIRLSEDLSHNERRIQEMAVDVATLREDLQNMERRAELAEQRSHDLETQWVVQRRDIQMTERQLGKGGWGFVKVAKFRGTEVAAKSIYEQIRSDYYEHLFSREMNMAARLRHPNLVQFIGATQEGEMIILTELMHTSLRRVLEQGGISREHIVSISVQVCRALNYLHLMQPDPVIHRDISSANVLLNPLPNNGWLAKVTDYGSVNTLRALQTENPGSPVYAAPEAKVPSLQSTKMDIFSVGVLLIEMCAGKLPSDDGREQLLYSLKDRRFIALIKHCINHNKDKRPTAFELIGELHQV